ncbi:MAG: hypothetical protein ABI995_16440, partial [Acidobacteriota bacterium]
ESSLSTSAGMGTATSPPTFRRTRSSAISKRCSIGGTVAFRFAARRPDRVQAMVIEESPAIQHSDLDFMRAWDGIFPTRASLEEVIGARLAWAVEPSFREVDHGWTLAFSAKQLADASHGLNGDF